MLLTNPDIISMASILGPQEAMETSTDCQYLHEWLHCPRMVSATSEENATFTVYEKNIHNVGAAQLTNQTLTDNKNRA